MNHGSLFSGIGGFDLAAQWIGWYNKFHCELNEFAKKILKHYLDIKYMGSKARYAKEILPIILKNLTPEQWYVEPFVGGMNMIDKVEGNRIANDINYELIQMWEALVNDDWLPNKHISREFYNNIRADKTNYGNKLRKSKKTYKRQCGY